MARIYIKGMELPELEEFVTKLGQPKFRAKQLAEWMYGRCISEFDEMTNLPLKLRMQLQQTADSGGIVLQARQQSSSADTIKYLFGLSDGQAVETVLMKHDYGCSVCVSSQAGCGMGCTFCASAAQGDIRNLMAGEMLDQILFVNRELRRTSERVGSVVIMGTGEPLANYDQTLKFLRLLQLPYGTAIGARHITISTCGLVPKIYELADQHLQITLAVSLHAPNDELRSRLMPVNRTYPLAKLMEACRYYLMQTNRRITFEYLLISEVNDSPEQAVQLGRLLHGLLCNVNLIPYNAVCEKEFSRPKAERVTAFQHILESNGVSVTLRREMGTDIDAACGQLRRRHVSQPVTPLC